MKKLLFIAVISLGLSANVNAQANEFGVKLGFNYSNFTGDDANDLDSKTGFHAGFMYHLGINDDFAFQPELLYSTKGAEELTLSYLDIPLMAHVHATEELSFHFGPQVGFLLSADNDGTDVKDFYKSTDLAAVLGAAYRLESGLFFDLRYNYGISNVGEEIETQVAVLDGNGQPTATTTTVTSEFKASNSVFQLSIGWMF